METKKIRIALIGMGQRGGAFISRVTQHPECELTVLCDTNEGRLHEFARVSELPNAALFTDYVKALDTVPVDAVVITVPDFAHAEVAVAALDRGIPVLLEKPMAPTLEGCRKIVEAQQRSGAIVNIGFVLRCHPMYRKAIEIVRSGRLGQIMSIQADESLGVMHGASYMRRWHRKTVNSGGFMLAKCSHDLDILMQLADSTPVRIASFGGCNFFLPEKQLASNCSKCDNKECRFRFRGEMVRMTEAETAEPSKLNLDLCVYTADKDVVDNQQTLIEFANGIRASFSLNLFAAQGERNLKIVGSEAYLLANDAKGLITIVPADGSEPEQIQLSYDESSGHHGSDGEFFNEFVECVKSGSQPRADYRAGVISTALGEAIEEALRSGTVVDFEKFQSSK